MKTGTKEGKFWIKVDKPELWATYCSWCFEVLGQPEDWFTGTAGKWSVNRKRHTFYFIDQQDRKHFKETWNVN